VGTLTFNIRRSTFGQRKRLALLLQSSGKPGKSGCDLPFTDFLQTIYGALTQGIGIDGRVGE